MAARVAQISCAAILGVNVGTLHHYASVVQIYQPDCAGVDGCREFASIEFQDESLDAGLKLLSSSNLANAFIEHIESTDYACYDCEDAIRKMRGGLSSLLSAYIETDRSIADF